MTTSVTEQAPRHAAGHSPQRIQHVWDALWRHQPSAAKDDALIERERMSPRWTRIREELVRVFGRVDGLRTIELGSGRGDLSLLLAQAGARVTLLDSSERALEQARARFDRLDAAATFVCGDMLGDLAPVCEGFDVSLSSGVIEHFRDDDRNRVLRSHLDVLVPGGLTVVSVPHAHCPPYRLWKLYLEARGWWPYGMEIPYSRGEIVRRSRQVGFQDARATCLGFWQSVSDHWGRSILHRSWDWSRRRSILDGTLGMTLLMFGRRAS